MRLIDADALVQALHKADTVMGQPHFLCKTVYGCINKAPTIDVTPKWIPCEERLPKPTQEVLVTGINGCVYTSRIVHGEFEYGGNVIAWMPMPKPYEGERKDDE